MFPAWMTYNLYYDVNRFARLATNVFGRAMNEANPEETAKAGIEAFRKFLISIGMPITFEQLGAKEEDIAYLAHTCCYGNGGSGKVGGVIALDEEAVKEIYRLML